MNLIAPAPDRTSAFLHPFSDLGSLQQDGPSVMTEGDGIYVRDESGKRYIEGNSGLWNAVLGFSDSRLADAASEQYRRLPAYHAFFGRVPETSARLARRLVDIAPVPMARVFFANSGSEANDTVVKMLWMLARAEGRPQRRKLLSRRGAYHGTTVMGTSLTGKDYVRAFGLPPEGVIFLTCPHYWREGRAGESEADFLDRLVAELEQTIVREGADTIAGMIAEPIMGAGGVIPPVAGYFAAIQPVLRRHHIPLVADEVISGFGRTGSLWGSQTYGVEPDLIIASKCITAGYFPMSAVMVSAEFDDRLTAASQEFGEFPHGFTTGAHPVGCAIALTVLDILLNRGVLDHLAGIIPAFQSRLRSFAGHPLIGEARGVGLMGALDVVADKPTKAPFPSDFEVGERIAKAAFRRGLIIRPLGNSVIFAPPFIMTRSEIDTMFDIVQATLDEVLEGLRA
ncbi:aminotransferase [Mesorhizobium australicum]|uniref:Adenosylmethionine-8-amino-7-oxononanoate aminotransferase n=1 Tax=Mesorhizobium australicum TaxID=536018 RepID=A0A1X7MNS6_9HYPH|nr:aminotransferase [Mesorhizobium australicum]SMH26492.1 Adenosylmethionine-8-amino-7-oxononanoate aminotransferase [Mesorhizobium australicum]